VTRSLDNLDAKEGMIMERDNSFLAVRRRFLRTWGAVPLALASSGMALPAWAQAAPTPECGDGDDPTPRQMEGPFFKPRTPRRISLLEPGITGTRLVLSGFVLSTACKPVAGALLDFWQANDQGDYDNQTYRLRGHQFTDGDGRYRLETIVPGLYPGRTRHIHVKVQVPNRPVLTTQVYFPGEAQNEDDFLFRADLLVKMRDAGGARDGRFDFVLKLA
jgi:protocatechuate 3,4-dioxygenase beta subunit